jgi:hypothetical protein
MIQRLPVQPDTTDDYSLAEETAGELLKDNRRLIAENKALKRLHVLSPTEDIRELPDIIDDGTLDVCHEVFRRIQAEMKSTRYGATFYARIAFRDCEFLPLETEGCWGDKAFKATFLPGFSNRGIGINAVYEVEVWQTSPRRYR